MTNEPNNPFHREPTFPPADQKLSFWVPLKAHADQYQDILRVIADPVRLERQGAFVVVSGADQIGKSTLLRQAAAEAHERLGTFRIDPPGGGPPGDEARVRVVDLRNAPSTQAPARPLIDQAQALCQELLVGLGSLADTERDTLERLAYLSPSDENYRLPFVYRTLTTLLRARAGQQAGDFVIVLLPAMNENAELIKDVAQLNSTPRIALLTETSYDPPRDHWGSLVTGGQSFARHVTLAHLTVEDAVEFLRIRQDELRPSLGEPMVSAGEVRKMFEDREFTIGFFQYVLGSIVEDFRSNNNTVTPVTCDEIYRIMGRKQVRSGSMGS